MMFVEINPIDPLFFRDARPFDKGSDSIGNSLNLPPLSTIHGALVAYYLKRARPKVNTQLEYYSIAKQLKIRGIYYRIVRKKPWKDLGLFLPAPADLVPTGKKQNESIFYEMDQPKLHENPKARTSSPFKFYLTSEYKSKPIGGNLAIGLDEFSKYLKGEGNLMVANLSSIITNEGKVGISIDNKTRNVKDEHFFHILQKRFENKEYKISFLLEIECPVEMQTIFKNSGIGRMGGEGKLSKISISTQQFDTSILTNSLSGKWQKLYFASPMVADWNLKGVENIDHTKIITASIPKPELLTGYDLVKKAPKPMMKIIPQGSVYYFEGVDLTSFHGIILPNSHAHQGFGRVYAGKIKE